MWSKIKIQAIELVQWAEKELVGKSGAQKRAAVVKKMCELVNIPYVPDWIEGMVKPLLFAYLVNQACNLLNILTEHDISAAVLTPELMAQAVGLIGVSADGTDILPAERELPDAVIEDVTAAASVDAKLQMLYEQYGGKKD